MTLSVPDDTELSQGGTSDLFLVSKAHSSVYQTNSSYSFKMSRVNSTLKKTKKRNKVKPQPRTH